MSHLPKAELERARDVGAATYINAFIRLMAYELKVKIDSPAQIAEAGQEFVEPMNQAMNIAWAIFVQDRSFAVKALDRLREIVDAALPPEFASVTSLAEKRRNPPAEDDDVTYQYIIIAKHSKNTKALPMSKVGEADLIVGKDNAILKDRYGGLPNPIMARHLERLKSEAHEVVEI